MHGLFVLVFSATLVICERAEKIEFVSQRLILVSISNKASSFEHGLDLGIPSQRTDFRRMVGHNLPVAIDKELSEVPGDHASVIFCALPFRVVGAEEFINWMRVRSVYIALGEHGERHIELGYKLFYFGISSFLLVIELIAGEG